MDVFAELYRGNREGVYNYFLRLTGDGHLAEELTHDTFLRALRFFAGFRGDASARTWIIRIAINVWHSHCRRVAKNITGAIDSAYAPDPRDQYAERTQQMLIDQVFSKLSQRERMLIVLRDINGLRYDEMATVLGLNEGQVRVGLHRARKRFRLLYTQADEEGKK